METIVKEIKHWEKLAEKYQRIGMEMDHNPLRQESFLVKAETYLYCAIKIENLLKALK